MGTRITGRGYKIATMEGRPNILLMTADDLNYNSVGAYGCGVENITPHLDQFAAEGMCFHHAHVNIAVCQPSRSVLMTGRYPHRNGALGFQPIDPDVPTLTELLHEAGYTNSIIGKENHLQPKEKFYWDHYVKVMDDENGQGRSPQVYYEYTKQVIEQSCSEGRPFFIMVNSHDPHRPFAGSKQELRRFGYATGVRRQYNAEEIEVPGFLPDIPGVRTELAQYFSSVHRLDETVGEVLRALEESGEASNTLVMFLSDNGMAFPFAKTNCYLNSTKTPWMVRWPGKVKPGSIDHRHFVSGIDFMPTILEAAGIETVANMDGHSFMPILNREEQVGREGVFTVFNRTSAGKDFPMRCYQDAQYGYIYNHWSDRQTIFRNESQSGITFNAMVEASEKDAGLKERVRFFQYRTKEEFYDFRKDPDALNNLIDHPEYAELIKSMRGLLRNKMALSKDPLVPAFDDESYDVCN